MTNRLFTIPRLGRALILPIVITVAGCATSSPPVADAPPAASADVYPAVDDNGVHIPAVTAADIDPALRRQVVDDPTGEPPGTIVVDPSNHALYLVQEGGKALRYGVGVGREGMEWSGEANVALKRAWPRWTPTKDMIGRDPETYARWSGGMGGGPDNPLGARALYLFADGKDTLYRIHGTNEPWSIGQSMSSGCIRMMNQDIMDLFARVPVGTRVVVRPVGLEDRARAQKEKTT